MAACGGRRVLKAVALGGSRGSERVAASDAQAGSENVDDKKRMGAKEISWPGKSAP